MSFPNWEHIRNDRRRPARHTISQSLSVVTLSAGRNAQASTCRVSKVRYSESHVLLVSMIDQLKGIRILAYETQTCAGVSVYRNMHPRKIASVRARSRYPRLTSSTNALIRSVLRAPWYECHPEADRGVTLRSVSSRTPSRYPSSSPICLCLSPQSTAIPSSSLSGIAARADTTKSFNTFQVRVLFGQVWPTCRCFLAPGQAWAPFGYPVEGV